MNNNTRKKIRLLIIRLKRAETNVLAINTNGRNDFVLEQMYNLLPEIEKLQYDIDDLGAQEIVKADNISEYFVESKIKDKIEAAADLIHTAVVNSTMLSDFYNWIDLLEDGNDIDLSEFTLKDIIDALDQAQKL